VIGRPELAELHLDGERQEELRAELAAVFGSRPLGDWLELCDREDVAVGPVATLAEAAAALGAPADARAPEIGEQTAAWRRELGLE
jgi:crotonobetainyl-CoA:carnitine CoA-transferase CaiB-like acyl-CoA transferase